MAFGSGTVASADTPILAESLAIDGSDVASIRLIKDPTVLLRKPGDANYGHWLVELLPRVLDIRAAFPELRPRYAVPAHPASMRALRVATLDWVGVNHSEIIWLNNELTEFDDLLLVSCNSVHSHTHDRDGLAQVAEAALQRAHPVEGMERIYVPRPPGHKRGPSNEGALRAMLLAAGYKVYSPELDDVLGQVATFASAREIVAPSGAALANLLFSSPECRVLAFMPSLGEEFFFWDLANIRGVEFSVLFCRATQPDKMVHSDYEVDLSAVSRWIGSPRTS
jgi:capsular polysaccharide biosynthesis protein